MGLQLRRGLEADRTTIIPAVGELIYTTDTKLVYVGDGSTVGGSAVTGGSGVSFATISVAGQSNVVADSATDTLTLVAGAGVTLTTNAGSDTITIAAPSDVVLDSTPQLGGDLDVNGHAITSAITNGNITISPNGTGRIFVTSGITRQTGNLNIAPLAGLTVIGDAPNGVDGNLYIVRDTYSAAAATGFTFAQHHDTAEAVNFSLFRSRGVSSAQTKVLNGDRLGNIVFGASDGTQALGGAVIQATAVADSSTNFLRANLRFLTSNGSFPLPHLELTYEGFLKVKTLQAYTGTNINIATNNTLTIGATRLDNNGLRTYASNADLTIAANGSGRIYLDGLAWPNSDGTNGQILSTNGAGNLSWTNTIGSIRINGSTIESTDSTTININENIAFVGDVGVQGSLGYAGPNVGGTVSQATDKSTAVTLNKICGSITTSNSTLAAGLETSFVVNNSLVDDSDVVLACIRSGGTAGAYNIQCDAVDNGQFRIAITNLSTSPLSEYITINFIIVKAVSS